MNNIEQLVTFLVNEGHSVDFNKNENYYLISVEYRINGELVKIYYNESLSLFEGLYNCVLDIMKENDTNII